MADLHTYFVTVGDEQALVHNMCGYKPPPEDLEAFPEAQRTKSKNQRKRWVDSEGNIYEWDYQHGAVEKYNKRGKHLGEYDPVTGDQLKPPDKTQTTNR